MTVSSVITLGYGSFAGVQYIPTLGYGNFGGEPPPAEETAVRHYPHRYPRWVVVGDKVHLVQSEAHEQRLIEQYDHESAQDGVEKPKRLRGKKAKKIARAIEAGRLPEMDTADRQMADLILQYREQQRRRADQRQALEREAEIRNARLFAAAMRAEREALLEEEEALILLMMA